MNREGLTAVVAGPGVVRCSAICDATTGKAVYVFTALPLSKIRRVKTRACETVTSYTVTLKGVDGRDLLNGRCASRATTGEQEELVYNPGTGTPVVTTNQDAGVYVPSGALTLEIATPGTSKNVVVELLEE